jgi:pimeloyl-ACP methyl ester carboxylesterase
MEAITEVETPFGPIQFRGRDTGRPVLLIITGAFADEGMLDHTQAFAAEADVWRAHLPGNHCPPLRETSIERFITAFDHAISAQARGRTVSVVGFSVGGVVALGLRAAEVRRILTIEPVLRTGKAWPFENFRGAGYPDWEAFTWPVLGIDRDRLEDRNYLHLLASLDRPALALIGGVPLLPRRDLPTLPSLVDDEVRAALRNHPRVECVEFPAAGHNLAQHDPDALLEAMRRTLRAAGAGG